MKMMNQTRIDQLTDDERRITTAFLNKICKKFDRRLVSVILCGSRARGEAEPDSDMDLLVVMTEVDDEIRQDVRHLAVEVWLDYGIYVSTRVWDQDHWHKLAALQTSLYRNICRDGLHLLQHHHPLAE